MNFMINNRVCNFFIIIWIAILISNITAIVSADPGLGPLEVKNQYPLFLMFLTPQPESTGLVQTKKLETGLAIDYSSVYLNSDSDNWQALMDMELMVLEFSAAYGLSSNLTLAAKIPLVSMNGGWMDGYLADYHDYFGFGNYGRDFRPQNEFGYSIKKDGKQWFDASSGGLHLADSTVSVKIGLLDEKDNGRFSLSFKYILKVPLGNKNHGFGSGACDHGFLLLSSINLDPLIVYLNPGYILLSDPAISDPQISVNNIYTLFAGIEYMVTQSWSVLTQLNCFTAPLEKTGISRLDQDSIELGLGIAWKAWTRGKLELAFCEDLTRTAPDFNLHFKITLQ